MEKQLLSVLRLTWYNYLVFLSIFPYERTPRISVHIPGDQQPLKGTLLLALGALG